MGVNRPVPSGQRPNDFTQHRGTEMDIIHERDDLANGIEIRQPHVVAAGRLSQSRSAPDYPAGD